MTIGLEVVEIIGLTEIILKNKLKTAAEHIAQPGWAKLLNFITVDYLKLLTKLCMPYIKSDCPVIFYISLEKNNHENHHIV